MVLLLVFFVLLLVATFTVDNSRLYYVAYRNEDNKECYGNFFNTREEAQAFCDGVEGTYVVHRGPLDFF